MDRKIIAQIAGYITLAGILASATLYLFGPSRLGAPAIVGLIFSGWLHGICWGYLYALEGRLTKYWDLKRSDHRAEKGMAIYFLFIAIALFGALGYAFLQGSRGNLGMITGEAKKAEDYRTQDCANSVNMALKRLNARGCGVTQISGDVTGAVGTGPADGSCAVYHPNGGGVKSCDFMTASVDSDSTPDLWPNPVSTDYGDPDTLHLYSYPRPVIGINVPVTVSIAGGTGLNKKLAVCNRCYNGDASTWSTTPLATVVMPLCQASIVTPFTNGSATITDGQCLWLYQERLSTSDQPTFLVNVGTETFTYHHTYKLICTKLFEMKLMPEKIFEADVAYAYKHFSMGAVKAYQLWGRPVANALPESPLLRAIVAPVTTAWAEHLAYLEGAMPEDNMAGRWLYNIFVPLHEMVGSVLYPELGMTIEEWETVNAPKPLPEKGADNAGK